MRTLLRRVPVLVPLPGVERLVEAAVLVDADRKLAGRVLGMLGRRPEEKR